MLLDANLLLYAVDETSAFHEDAREWMESTLRAPRRVAIPWQTIGAFLRISTNPRVTNPPLTGADAWRYVEDWLAAPPTWVPAAGERTARVYADMVRQIDITGNLVTDAMLAALAIEHGLEVMTLDTDFARFPGVRWRNPLLG